MSNLALAFMLATVGTPADDLQPLPLPPVAVLFAEGASRLEFSIATASPENYDPRWGTIYAVSTSDTAGLTRSIDSRTCPQIAYALGAINGFFSPLIDAGMPFMTMPEDSRRLPPGLPPPPALDGVRVTLEVNAVQPGGQPARLSVTGNSGAIVDLYHTVSERLEPCLSHSE